MNRALFSTGSLLAFLAVGLGAFGTHGLRDRLSEKMLETWHTGVQYHLAHALAVLIVAMVAPKVMGATISGWLFVAGVVVFSGTLYLYSVTGTTAFAMVTPLGGLCFLAGWAWLFLSSLRSREHTGT